jgi:hypothetical protein
MTNQRKSGNGHEDFYIVMAGLVPAIHVFSYPAAKTWLKLSVLISWGTGESNLDRLG